MKGFKKKQILASMTPDRKNMFSPPKAMARDPSGKLRDSWINRSKEMRESFMSRLQTD